MKNLKINSDTLRIKPELIGSVIMRNNVTLDTINTIKESYLNFYNNGFADCFEEAVPVIKYRGVLPNTKEIE